MNIHLIHSNKVYRPIKSRTGVIQVLIVFCFIVLAACNVNPSPQATKPLLASSKTAQPAPPLTSTATITPTPRLPVTQNTSVPVPSLMISEDNINQVVELARWHKGVITDAVYSPDGKTIAVASTVGIFLYKAEGLEEILGINTETRVNSIAFSPEGDRFATGLNDYTVKIWAIDGTLLQTLKAHTGNILAVVFSPNGKYLVSASNDRTVIIWNAMDGSLVHMYVQDANPYCVIFSPDGSNLFIGSELGTSMISLEDGKLIHLFHGHSIHEIALSKDGGILAAYGTQTLYDPNGEVDIWQISGWKKLANIKGGSGNLPDIESIALSSDGRYIAAGWGNYSAKIWNASNGSLQSTLEDLKPKSGHFYYNFFAVAFSPDDNSLLMAGSNVMGIWDVRHGNLLQNTDVQSQPIYRIKLSGDGLMLASVEGFNIRLLNMSTGQIIIPQNEEIESNGDVAISPDGSSLAVGLSDGTARIWPLTEKGISRSFETEKKGGFFTGVAFSPNGQVLALAASYPGIIELRNISDGSLLNTINIGANISYVTLAYSPDGEYLAASAADSVRIFRTSDGKSIGTYKGGISLAFSPDGTLIAGGALQDAVRVWEITTGKLILNITPPLESVTSVVFSNDGKLLVSGGSGGSISVWNVSNGMLLKSWVGHSDSVSGLIFTSDGKKLISSSLDGTIRLWGIKPFNPPTTSGFSPCTISGLLVCSVDY